MFSFISQRKKGTVLGIDIGVQSTKITRLVHREGKPSFIDFATIIEMDSKDPKFEHALRECIQKNKLSGMPVAFSIEDASFKIRKVELPKMPEADLKEAVKWKMRDVVDGNVDDFIIRYSQISTSSDGKRNTLVGYAAKKSAVNEMLALADRLGLDAQWIEPTAVNLSAAIEVCSNPDEEWVAGIDLGQSKAILVILGNGKFYFSRPLAGVNLAAAEQGEATFNQKLAAEIQNSLDTFAVTFNVEHISRVYLSGGGAMLPGLADYLSQNLGIPSQIIDPFKGLEIKQDLADLLLQKAPLMTMAVSLARLKI